MGEWVRLVVMVYELAWVQVVGHIWWIRKIKNWSHNGHCATI